VAITTVIEEKGAEGVKFQREAQVVIIAMRARYLQFPLFNVIK
jgi:hypothetical protein